MRIKSIIFLVCFFLVCYANAQTLLVPKTETYKAEIINVSTSTFSTSSKDFILRLEGSKDLVNVYSNGLPYSVGDEVFVSHIQDTDGSSYWSLGEYNRLGGMFYLLFIFILVVIGIFGVKGLKSLISLALSFLIIIFILIPLTLKGYNPLIVSAAISLLLLSIVMIFTHGKNAKTWSALIGCYVAALVTIVLAYISVIKNKITGFSSEETVALFYNASGVINFELLVVSSIIIGVIGVVDDSAITQAGVVAELKNANPNLSIREYYKRAMRIGRDHAGAMINTLMLAYTGSALPILLLFKTSTSPALQIINKEIIATEIIRSLVGSIGLLLAIPLTTLCAVYLVKGEDAHIGHKH